jgi:hypothetical protein
MEYYGPHSIFLLQFGTKINIFEDMEQTCVGPNKIAPIATCRPQLYVQINKNHAILYILYIMHLLYVYYYFLCIIKMRNKYSRCMNHQIIMSKMVEETGWLCKGRCDPCNGLLHIYALTCKA